MRSRLLPLFAALLALTACSCSDEKKAGNAETSAGDAAVGPSGTGRVPGIDVSHFQGEVDWSGVRLSGTRFSYIKVSEGLHTGDPHMIANWSGATGTGIVVGGYHLFHPDEDAVDQARHFISRLQEAGISYKGALPPVIDIETAEGVRPPAYHKDILAWLDYVEKALGCRPIIYTAPDFWDRTEEHQHLRGYDLWLADYDSQATLPDGWSRWLFWQHTQSGKVEGVTTAVDKNWFGGGPEELETLRCR